MLKRHEWMKALRIMLCCPNQHSWKSYMVFVEPQQIRWLKLSMPNCGPGKQRDHRMFGAHPGKWSSCLTNTIYSVRPNKNRVLFCNIAEEDGLFHIYEVICVSGIDHVSNTLSLSASFVQTIARGKTKRVAPRKVRNSSMTRVLSNAVDIVDNAKSVLTRSHSRGESSSSRNWITFLLCNFLRNTMQEVKRN